MESPMKRREFLTTTAAALALPISTALRDADRIRGLPARATERHLLYIAEPGIRNYVSYGGVGVLIYDIGNGYQFVKRIPTWKLADGKDPENVKGVAASAKT